MTTTIVVCMTGSYEETRIALDKHDLPVRSIVEVVGGPPCTTTELPDSPEIREKVKHLAGEFYESLRAVNICTVYPGSRR